MLPRFRDYDVADRDSCVSIFRSNIPRYFREHELAEFLEFLDSSECLYFVVTDNDLVVACGGFGIGADGDGADLCWGMVESSAHGKRLGEFLLLGRLQRISSETEAKHVRLGTCQLTEGFFRRYGFETQSHTTDGVADGLDDVQMRMELTDENRRLIGRQWIELRP